jgi:N-acetylglutamate synthase-like GNAT family acetyltransferase
MTAYIISKANLKDCPALNKLINSAYRGEYSRQGWTTEADLLDGTRTDEKGVEEIINKKGSVILKYVEDGKILGCVRLDKKDKKLYLGMLTVEPSLQNKGIGKILLKTSEDEARKQNCNSIYMTVISVRDELIGWYKRHGYYDTGKRQPFNSSDPRFGIPKMKLEFVVLEKELK